MGNPRYSAPVVITPVDAGTQVTVSWEFLPNGITRFHDGYGDDAEAQIADRTAAARSGIPVTLAALKRAAEAMSSRTEKYSMSTTVSPARMTARSAPATNDRPCGYLRSSEVWLKKTRSDPSTILTVSRKADNISNQETKPRTLRAVKRLDAH